MIEKILIPDSFHKQFSDNEEVETDVFDLNVVEVIGGEIGTIINPYDNHHYVVCKNLPSYTETKNRWFVVF
jgi:hypothetical protein